MDYAAPIRELADETRNENVVDLSGKLDLMNFGPGACKGRPWPAAEAPEAESCSKDMTNPRRSDIDASPERGARIKMMLEFVTERDSEYSRISRFLHDEVGQVLSAVGLQLDAMRHDFSRQAPEIDGRAAEMQQMLETVIGRIRDLSYELNPSVVQRTGLQFALSRLADRFRDRFPSIRLQLDPGVRIAPQQAEAMFRAAEAVVELAGADPLCTNLDIQLKRSRAGYVLEIRGNARLELDTEARFPALLASYYASRNGIALTVNRSGEKDTIVKFSCAPNE